MNMTWSEMIELAMMAEPEPACRDAVKWAKSVAGTDDATINAMIVKNAGWALWGVEFIGLELTDEQFECAVEAKPWMALMYCHVCDKLTNKQFERAVEVRPRAALMYSHACDRLTDKQFERAVKAEPWMALECRHACDRLTDEQLSRAVKAEPRAALEYEHVKKRAEAK